uniref:Ovule protein n=1 Tax=Haemonchus contortus TaxID=6289 RepID=A0A7I4Z373_HAECO
MYSASDSIRLCVRVSAIPFNHHFGTAGLFKYFIHKFSIASPTTDHSFSGLLFNSLAIAFASIKSAIYLASRTTLTHSALVSTTFHGNPYHYIIHKFGVSACMYVCMYVCLYVCSTWNSDHLKNTLKIAHLEWLHAALVTTTCYLHRHHFLLSRESIRFCLSVYLS